MRIGLIGEIGVSSDFTEDERKSLRGAARAQARTGLPLMVHLPGWFRLGHAVLDLAEAEGADPSRTILCHMNPSWDDQAYQRSLAARGAFIEYDMIGMDYFYADQGVQCPSDDEAAQGILALIEAGFADRIPAQPGRVPQDDAHLPRRRRLRPRAAALPAAPRPARDGAPRPPRCC